MRWDKNPAPKFHSRRKVRKFLIFPKTIGLQTRWLEYATIVQFYDYSGYWVDLEWD